MFNTPTAIPNLNPEQIKFIESSLGMKLDWEADITKSYLDIQGYIFSPTDLLDYIYAVLHTPQYRDKYKEFLKIDFPRVPFDVTPEKFWKLVKIGGQLRKLHLLEDETLDNSKIGYPIAGDNVVEKVSFEFNNSPLEGWQSQTDGVEPNLITKSTLSLPIKKENITGKVFINSSQYFDGVSVIAWEFYIGGYQPAQKWLKDRKDNVLTFEDIAHYQKLVASLDQTSILMQELEKHYDQTN
jgi:Type ISP C-terminal specificity domain